MKKTFKLERLDCATKMETAISAIDGVISARVNFMMQRLTIEADESVFDEVLKKAEKAIARVEPDCRISF